MKVINLLVVIWTASLLCSVHFYFNEPVLKKPQNESFRSNPNPKLIPLDAKRWYILNAHANGLAELFDGDTATSINTGYPNFKQNYLCVYPLDTGESMLIQSIRMFDGAGDFLQNPANIYAIRKSGEFVKIASFNGDKYMQWVGPDSKKNKPAILQFDVDTLVEDMQYLAIRCTRNNLPNEIQFFGRYNSSSILPSSEAKPAASFENMLGVNGFEWDFVNPAANSRQIDENKYKAIANFTGFRHYLDWGRMEDQKGQYSFNPCHNGGWDLDMTYERCKRDGITVLVCLKNITKWLKATYPINEQANDNVPAPYLAKRDLPASYSALASMAFQFAARYGSNKQIEISALKVNTKPRWPNDPPNQIKRGLSYIRYIECGNEYDKWWRGSNGYMNCYEYAALLSAFYDGDQGRLGPYMGIKQADSNMQVVMTGLAHANPSYVRGMMEWCRQNRGYHPDGSINICWDIINYHHYASNKTSSNEDKNLVQTGVAPELGNSEKIAQSFVEFAQHYFKGMPVWMTETGYDLHPNSALRAVGIGKKTPMETQADWLLRAALIHARTGIQRMFYYQLFDYNLEASTKFASMGLVDKQMKNKASLDRLCQFTKLLTGYHFEKNIGHSPEVDVYTNGSLKAWIIWMPTMQGKQANCTINLSDETMGVTLYQSKFGIAEWEKTNYANGTSTIELLATETPVVLMQDSNIIR